MLGGLGRPEVEDRWAKLDMIKFRAPHQVSVFSFLDFSAPSASRAAAYSFVFYQRKGGRQGD